MVPSSDPPNVEPVIEQPEEETERSEAQILFFQRRGQAEARGDCADTDCGRDREGCRGRSPKALAAISLLVSRLSLHGSGDWPVGRARKGSRVERIVLAQRVDPKQPWPLDRLVVMGRNKVAELKPKPGLKWRIEQEIWYVQPDGTEQTVLNEGTVLHRGCEVALGTDELIWGRCNNREWEGRWRAKTQAQQEDAVHPRPAGGESVVCFTTLDAVWSAIRAAHADVPPVVLLTAPGERSQRKIGHFWALKWQHRTEGNLHEVVLVAEYLNRTASDVLEVLLHEAAHACNFVRGIRTALRTSTTTERFGRPQRSWVCMSSRWVTTALHTPV